MRKVSCFVVIEPDSNRYFFMPTVSEEYVASMPKATEIFELEAFLPAKEVPLTALPNMKGNVNARVRKLR